jgi:YidC/Oxa1 family membrane protein insertase
MANCPVDSMTTGGLLWFVDLTTKDPFYALPIITCGSVFVHLKLGADGVDLNSMQKHVRTFLLCLPLISLPIMCQFPTVRWSF